MGEKEVMGVVREVLAMLEGVHQHKIAYLNVRPESIVPVLGGGYCAINFDKAIAKVIDQKAMFRK